MFSCFSSMMLNEDICKTDEAQSKPTIDRHQSVRSEPSCRDTTADKMRVL